MKKSRKKRGRIIAVWGAVGLLLATAAVCAGILLPYVGAKMDMSLLERSAVREPAALYAYDPTERALRAGELHPAPTASLAVNRPRIYTPYEEIPPELICAFVSIEDKRFWKHSGVDMFRTARAGVGFLTGRTSFGGSTITQQLIKNLTGNDSHTVRRKLTEIFQAMDLERQTDKTRILEAYLNVINLADGCFGVGAAAKRYFSKPVSELTLAECASIAAITNNPARYNPLTHPENNRARRDLILREMASQGYITEAQREAAAADELMLTPASEPSSDTPSSWYADMVVSDVIRDLQTRLGYTYEAASRLVYQGGLRIETAMDEALQAAVEAYYAEAGNFPAGENGQPQSAVIVIDPSTGDILAVAGAIGEKTASRLQNYATDTRRPAGSCIKPLTVYAPALERGIITWASICEDEPISTRRGAPWPSNADGLYRGRVSVKEAVAKSLNPAAVRILEQVGLENAFSFAREKLGLKSLIPAEGVSVGDLTVSSLALGQQCRGVSARELTAAYTVFSDGIYRAPVSYHRVLDADGRVLLENPPADEASRALSSANAALMTRLLTTVTKEGTAARYITVTDTLGIETAGKTGTTQNNCDRWFIGYTPRLLAGVWMGYDYPAELAGIRGNPCVSIWNDLMLTCEPLYKGAAEKSAFDIPDDLVEAEYCPLSGLLPNEFCTDPVCGRDTERGWFVRDTEPTETCTHHKEPLIRLIPEDPLDPDRIPLFPGEAIPDTDIPRRPWYKRFRWFGA